MVPLDMTNEEIRGDLLILAPAIMSQPNRVVVSRVNTLESNMTSRLREFVRMNPLTFLCSKVGEDLQALFDEVYTIVCIMGVSSRNKVEFSLYQFK